MYSIIYFNVRLLARPSANTHLEDPHQGGWLVRIRSKLDRLNCSKSYSICPKWFCWEVWSAWNRYPRSYWRYCWRYKVDLLINIDVSTEDQEQFTLQLDFSHGSWSTSANKEKDIKPERSIRSQLKWRKTFIRIHWGWRRTFWWRK